MRSGFDVARIPAGLTRGLYMVAAAGFVIAATTHLLTYTPVGSADALQVTSMLAFPVMFPVWGVMLFAIFLGRVPFDRVLSSLPLQVKLLEALLLAYVALDFFFGLVANLALALYQRRRLLSLIERAVDALRVRAKGGPN